MHDKQLLLKGLRGALIIGGGLMIILALAADRLGFGSAGSIGIGQILLIAIGLLAMLVGVLGSRFAKLYQNTATVLLNTIVLLVLVELVAILFGRSLYRLRQSEIQTLSYYTNQDWAEVYWQEASQTNEVHYKPYVIWEKNPFAGETINFDHKGIRQTPGAECVAGAYRVFTFGGSTMVGWGSPDWGTIPAYLQSGLDELMEVPVCVVNFGEDGYVSTQSLISLILELQAGNTPDAVFFYDGINDILAAYESQQAGVHVTLPKIAAIFEGQENPLLTWARGTRTFALLQNLSGKIGQDRPGNIQASSTVGEITTDTSSLANAVSQIYLANYEMVSVLAQEYDFLYAFYLQPHPAVARKRLTDEEFEMLSRMDPGLSNLAQTAYRNVALAAPERDNLWYIADIFDLEEGQIWVDEVGHITPEGNLIIAQKMLEAFENSLPK